MDTHVIAIFVVFGAIAGSIALARWYFSKDARTKRSLKAAERVSIEQAQDGEPLKIVGRVAYARDQEILTAPLSQRQCACWEVVIEERSRNKNSNWREIIRDQDARPFLVDDGTDIAFVKAALPQMAMQQDMHYSSGTFDDATPELERFLQKFGHQSTGVLGFNKRMRYREGVLEEGESVAVLGIGRWEPDPDGQGSGYRESPMRLVITEDEQGLLLLSDDWATTSE